MNKYKKKGKLFQINKIVYADEIKSVVKNTEEVLKPKTRNETGYVMVKNVN